jgi:ferredoxin-NADP reductase
VYQAQSCCLQIRELVERCSDRAVLHVACSKPRDGLDVLGLHYDAVGRLDASAVDAVVQGKLGRGVAGADADYVLCGPSAFMASVIEGLVAMGVRPERIHMESFGPEDGR